MREEKACQICQLEFGPLQAKVYCQESNTVHCEGCEDILPVQCITVDGSEEYQKICARSKAGEFWISEVERGARATWQFTVRRDVSVIKNLFGKVIWRKRSMNEIAEDAQAYDREQNKGNDSESSASVRKGIVRNKATNEGENE